MRNASSPLTVKNTSDGRPACEHDSHTTTTTFTNNSDGKEVRREKATNSEQKKLVPIGPLQKTKLERKEEQGNEDTVEGNANKEHLEQQ